MNVIENEAKEFLDDLYNASSPNTLSNLTDRIEDKLYTFRRDRDKLDFLRILLVDSEKEKAKHELDCQKSGCSFSEDREYGKFAIEQQIDDINEYYSYEPKSSEEFSAEEESILHSKLNEIIDRLKKQELGQEIIFDEIDSLKNHFNLGKRNWFQLLKGKLIDLTIEKVLEKTIVEEIYKSLSEGFSEVTKLIQ